MSTSFDRSAAGDCVPGLMPASCRPQEPLARRFANRVQAGRLLAGQIARLDLAGRVVVLGLPRGGIPVASEVARVLAAPLELLFVRRIAAPWHPEITVAALVDGSPPQLVANDSNGVGGGIDAAHIESQTRRALADLARLRHVYGRPQGLPQIDGATVVVVDDGIASGTTMRAALLGLRQLRPARIVLGVPVAPADVLDALRRHFDEIVCLLEPENFRAVCDHYLDFGQVDDDEAIAALDAADDARSAVH